MGRLVKMELGNGVKVWVETRDDLVPEVQDVAGRRVAERALHEALDAITAFGKDAAKRLRDLAEAAEPDEVSIELGVSIAAEAGVVFTSGSAGAMLNVTMTWKGSGKE